MVHTHVNYFNYELPVLIEFGKGDIMVTTGDADTHSSIVFSNIQPTEIGIDLKDDIKDFVGKGVTQLEPDAIINFTASKSIDVVITALLSIKESLVEKGL